ncbi:MAG: twin-arginine translocase TatA/TatE family subunit [Akkermansiaceae bacterium]|nr:twin-arginine translocase TatA/TatE family subunit [Akkermansiaceae bacterium]
MIATIFSPTQWLVVLVILFLLFGAKRLPEIARSLGKSLGEFKKARQEFEDELMNSSTEEPDGREKKTLASDEESSKARQSEEENKERPGLRLP